MTPFVPSQLPPPDAERRQCRNFSPPATGSPVHLYLAFFRCSSCPFFLHADPGPGLYIYICRPDADCGVTVFSGQQGEWTQENTWEITIARWRCFERWSASASMCASATQQHSAGPVHSLAGHASCTRSSFSYIETVLNARVWQCFAGILAVAGTLDETRRLPAVADASTGTLRLPRRVRREATTSCLAH